MSEGEAEVGEAEDRKGAALIRMNETLGPGDGVQPCRHHLFEDLLYSFEPDNNAEGGRGVIGSLARFVQDQFVGGF